MNHIRIKVCGMKDPLNMEELHELPIDLMGMIFYPKSPRYIGNLEQNKIPSKETIKRVGVFVNEDIKIVEQNIDRYSLDLVQLHGNESLEYCLSLNKLIPVIKAFSIKDGEDIKQVNNFGKFDGYILLDTKTPQYGGAGYKFDWKLLNLYTADMPFYLSGGISVNDVELIKKIAHPQFYGVDLNSKFEFEFGLKNINLLKTFINELRS